MTKLHDHLQVLFDTAQITDSEDGTALIGLDDALFAVDEFFEADEAKVKSVAEAIAEVLVDPKTLLLNEKGINYSMAKAAIKAYNES